MKPIRPYRYVQRLLCRDGVWRNYLRHPTLPRVAIVGDYGSPEFAANYLIAMGGGTLPATAAIARNANGTFGALVTSYLQSPAWLNPARDPKGLSDGTRKRRIAIIEKFRRENADDYVNECTRRHVEGMIEGLTPCVQQDLMKIIRALFAHAQKIGLIENDPSQSVKASRPDTEGFHTWTDGEIAQYRAHHAIGTQARMALEFALEAASRRCEVINITRQHLTVGNKGERRIIIKRAKGSLGCDIELTDELAAAIDAMPVIGQRPFLPFSADTLGRHFAQWCRDASLPDRCRMHGLKKACVRQVVESGATTAQGMAVTGHKSIAVYERYGKKYNRAAAADTALALRAKRNRNAA